MAIRYLTVLPAENTVIIKNIENQTTAAAIQRIT